MLSVVEAVVAIAAFTISSRSKTLAVELETARVLAVAAFTVTCIGCSKLGARTGGRGKAGGGGGGGGGWDAWNEEWLLLELRDDGLRDGGGGSGIGRARKGGRSSSTSGRGLRCKRRVDGCKRWQKSRLELLLLWNKLFCWRLIATGACNKGKERKIREGRWLSFGQG